MFRKLLDLNSVELNASFPETTVSAPILFEKCEPNLQRMALQQDYLELEEKLSNCGEDNLLENFRQELNYLDRMSADELKCFRKRIAKIFHPDRLDENASKLAKEFMTLANVKIDSEIGKR